MSTKKLLKKFKKVLDGMSWTW